jgi:D-glycero-alpha-D-manno-heptose-7-phosphate kinase
MIIRARAPLRLGLCGGGTDVSPYCDEYGGAVLSVTIDLYAYANIEPTVDGRAEFAATDMGDHYIETGDAVTLGDPLRLHRAVYLRMMKDYNKGVPLSCRITTFCDAPPGSGLGTSSTMVVAMVTAFAEWLNLPLGDYEVARLAFEIERQDAALAGGRQDQYAAAFGGVNFMEFYDSERVVVNPLRIKDWIVSELETSMVLYDSGVSRSSARIIDEQTANVKGNTGTTLEALHELKKDSFRMKECLLKGDFDGLAEVLRKTWEDKKRLSSVITNPRLDRVMQIAQEAGAVAGKVSGAGGGGFLAFLTTPARRMEVIRALSEWSPGRVMPCHLTHHGAEAWRSTPLANRF